MVPNKWSVFRIWEVCESVSVGIVIKPSQYYVTAGNGVKAFRSANVMEGKIKDSDWVYLSHDGHRKNSKSSLKAGDVLVVRTGYPGTACVVTDEFEGSNAIDIVIARPDEKKVKPEYLCAYTNSSVGKNQVSNVQGGLAQQHLNVGAYKNIKILLPPIVEQAKITQILSTWDKAIETTEKLILNSKAQKKALMQQLLTGKKRFPGFNGVWRRVRMDILLDGKKRKGKIIPTNQDRNGIPYIGSTSFKGGFDLFTRSADALTCKPSDILILWDGEYAGKVATGLEGAVSSTVVRYRINGKTTDSQYLAYSLLKDNYKVRAIREGSGIPHMPGDFEHWYGIYLPPLTEQKKISSALSLIDREIELFMQQLECLRQEKKSLMQQLLTGKRRVRVDS